MKGPKLYYARIYGADCENSVNLYARNNGLIEMRGVGPHSATIPIYLRPFKAMELAEKLHEMALQQQSVYVKHNQAETGWADDWM